MHKDMCLVIDVNVNEKTFISAVEWAEGGGNDDYMPIGKLTDAMAVNYLGVVRDYGWQPSTLKRNESMQGDVLLDLAVELCRYAESAFGLGWFTRLSDAFRQTMANP